MASPGKVWLVLLRRRWKGFGTPQRWPFAQHCEGTIERPSIVHLQYLNLCYMNFTSVNYLKKNQPEGGWGGKQVGGGPNQKTSGIPGGE